MKQHIIDLFKQDEHVTEINAKYKVRYVLIHNLVVEVNTTVVTDIAILQKATVKSTSEYYYDMLKPKCLHSDVDFSSLLIEFLNHEIKIPDLIEFED